MFGKIRNRKQEQLATSIAITGVIFFFLTQWFIAFYAMSLALYITSFERPFRINTKKKVITNTIGFLLLLILIFSIQQIF